MPSAGSVIGGAAGGALSGAKFGPWGAAIGGGIGLLGGLFGGGNSPADDASKAIFKNVPKLIDQGNTNVGAGVGRLNQAGNFYSTILGGNREQINSLLSPEVSTVLSQYDNAANTIKQFSPRGGGTTQTLAQLPFAKTAAAGQAYQGLLPSAASGEAGVGAAQAGIGTNLLAEAGGAGGTAFQYSNLAAQLQKGLGSGVGQITGSGSVPGAAGAGGAGTGGVGGAASTILSAGKGLGGWLAKILTKGGGGGNSTGSGVDASLIGG